MQFECYLYCFPGRFEVRRVDGSVPPLVFSDSDIVKPDIDHFTDVCVIAEGPEQFQPGANWKKQITITDIGILKSWWKQDRFLNFFQRSRSAMVKPKVVDRRKLNRTIEIPTYTNDVVRDVDKVPSAPGLFASSTMRKCKVCRTKTLMHAGQKECDKCQE